MQGASAEVVSTVIALAEENWGKTPAQLAIAWIPTHPEVTVAISGGDTVAHLDDNLGAVGWTLGDSGRERLNAMSAPFK